MKKIMYFKVGNTRSGRSFFLPLPDESKIFKIHFDEFNREELADIFCMVEYLELKFYRENFLGFEADSAKLSFKILQPMFEHGLFTETLHALHLYVSVDRSKHGQNLCDAVYQTLSI